LKMSQTANSGISNLKFHDLISSGLLIGISA
jgi:hypothetical protein